MADLKNILAVVDSLSSLATSEKGQKFICGTYSNGKPRNLVDALRDECISPKDRKKWEKKKKKKAKKRKKNGKKKKKQTYSGVDLFRF